MTAAAIDAAFARLNAAEMEHADIVCAKYRAIGKRFGVDYVPELDSDPEIVAAHERVKAAQRAYAAACGEVQP